MANKNRETKRKQSHQRGRSSTRTGTQRLRLNERIANHQAEADEIQDIAAGREHNIPPCKDCIAVMASDPEAKCWDGPDECVPCLEEGLVCGEFVNIQDEIVQRLMRVQQALKEAEVKLGPRSIVIDQLRQDQMEACQAISGQGFDKNATQQEVFNGETLHQRIMRLESNAFRSSDFINKRINSLRGEFNELEERIRDD